jgi:hypothetical protein
MPVPNGVDPKEVINNGIFYRNPTHLKIAERARNQSEIVQQINESSRKKRHEVFLYDSDQETVQYPGMRKIREMMMAENAEEQLTKFFAMLLRSKPNVYLVRISLGEYPSMKEIRDRKVDLMKVSSPRYYNEVAQDIGSLFADRRINVTDFVYIVKNTNPGNFSTEAQAWGGVTNEELLNDKFFNPVIELEYQPN